MHLSTSGALTRSLLSVLVYVEIGVGFVVFSGPGQQAAQARHGQTIACLRGRHTGQRLRGRAARGAENVAETGEDLVFEILQRARPVGGGRAGQGTITVRRQVGTRFRDDGNGARTRLRVGF